MVETDLTSHFAKLSAESPEESDTDVDYRGKNSLSQQALMELFFDGIENKEAIRGPKGELKLISEWNGVTLNEAEEVVEIDWEWLLLRGTVDFNWLPPTVETLSLTGNMLTGPADLSSLPESMKNLHLNSNMLSGEVYMERLPKGIELLCLNNNNFSGSVSFNGMPKTMKCLNLENNVFEGTVSFEYLSLVPKLAFLSLKDNRFSGPIDLTDLPRNLSSLHIGGNMFSGQADFGHLKNVQYLDVSGNEDLSGDIHIKRNESKWYMGEMHVNAANSRVNVVYSSDSMSSMTD